MGYIHDTRVYNPMPLIIRGNVLQSRGRVDWLPDANASQPSLTFSTDPDTGLYRPGENQLALATGGVDRAVFDLHGANITGTLVASSHVVGSAFFGDGGGLGNIQVSNVVGLSDALQTVEANTVTANVVTAGTFFGDGSALTGLVRRTCLSGRVRRGRKSKNSFRPIAKRVPISAIRARYPQTDLAWSSGRGWTTRRGAPIPVRRTYSRKRMRGIKSRGRRLWVVSSMTQIL